MDSSQMEKRRGERRVEELMDLVQQELGIKLADLVQRDKRLYDLREKVKRGDLEPYSSAVEVFTDMLPHLTWNSN